MLNQKADLGQKDNRGYTPIHNAIVAQNLVPFHILIKVAGRDFPMHEMSLSSVTPLHMVVCSIIIYLSYSLF